MIYMTLHLIYLYHSMNANWTADRTVSGFVPSSEQYRVPWATYSEMCEAILGNSAQTALWQHLLPLDSECVVKKYA